MHGKLHQSKPDLDNLLKAVTDALLSEDMRIGHFGELSKIWVNSEEGWIEFHLSESKYEETVLPRSICSFLKTGKNKKSKKKEATLSECAA